MAATLSILSSSTTRISLKGGALGAQNGAAQRQDAPEVVLVHLFVVAGDEAVVAVQDAHDLHIVAHPGIQRLGHAADRGVQAGGSRRRRSGCQHVFSSCKIPLSSDLPALRSRLLLLEYSQRGPVSRAGGEKTVPISAPINKRGLLHWLLALGNFHFPVSSHCCCPIAVVAPSATPSVLSGMSKIQRWSQSKLLYPSFITFFMSIYSVLRERKG